MHKVKVLSAAAAIFFIFSAGSAVFAEDTDSDAAPAALAGEELAKSKNCLTCHKVDAKSIGPSFQEIAAKYTEDDAAVATLEKSIKEGSEGKYGGIAMPAQKQVSDEDAAKLSEWVMTLGAKSE